MNQFKNATMQVPDTVGWNGMPAHSTTHSACVNLFFAAGASRGKNISKEVKSAYKEDPLVTLQILQWLRDCRGGAGERKLFRDSVSTIMQENELYGTWLLFRAIELGRWDDVFDNYFSYSETVKNVVIAVIMGGLLEGNGLLAKWLPRKGPLAVEFTKKLGMTPKQYRKTLVALTKVVETQMCNGEWKAIEYHKVPSLAAARYQKAFAKHDPTGYEAYRKALVKGVTKINAGAVYPYDVLKAAQNSNQWDIAEAQWNAIDLKFSSNILPLVDVSGSMCTLIGGSKTLQAIDVAISLGLFLSQRNQGKFKDLCVTFHSKPSFVNLSGSLLERYEQLRRADWGGSTNLQAAMRLVLDTAVKYKVSTEEMPDTLLILSDMQFDTACRNTGLEMIEAEYTKAGYEMPKVVFWNLNHAGNFPATSTKNGVALVSGFSPAIVKNLTNLENFTPYSVMRDTVSKYPVPVTKE